MKTITIKQLNEKNEEIADKLISLGMSRPIARVLSYLKYADKATTVELERGSGLRQPEVSIAMRELKEHDWIDEREEKKPGKGRPYKIYSLRVGFIDIVTYLEKQKQKAVEEALFKIKRLRELENIAHVG